MIQRHTLMKTAILAALCGAAIGFANAQTPAASSAPVAAASALPGDDFFKFVNAEWLAKNPIPADRSAWSSMGVLSEATNARIAKMIESIATDKNAKGDARMVANYYNAYMDEAGIEAKGIAPLKARLAEIAAIKDKAGLAHALGTTLRADVDPLNTSNMSTENLFGMWVAQGLNDPAHNMAYLLQGGLGLPDRAYYVGDSAGMVELRAKYKAHIAALLKLAGFDNTDTRAANILTLETTLAKSHFSREDSNDIQKANNKWSLKDFATKAPGLDWTAYFKGAQLSGQKEFMVWQPSALTGAAAAVAATDLATWKDYMAFHYINHTGAFLPKAFVEQRFAFYGTALQGTPQMSARWKRALNATNAAVDEAVGHLYVERFFPAEDKARVQKMVANIVTAFGKRVEKLEWMDPATRTQALAKLHSLYVGIGYPEHWKSYAGLKIAADDAFGNAERAEHFQYAQALVKLGKKPERTEWAMPSHVINAINLPLQNALNFPAAILQPPMYDPKASDAANYGSIGAVIGHEISHSFDDQGAQFDAEGRLRDWWTKGDLEHFKKASAQLVAQYSAYKPFADLAVNGQQTLSENLADLAGLGASYDAYVAANGGKTTPEMDKAFFLGFGRTWSTNQRDASLRQSVLTDGHAPGQYRAQTVRNLDAWYKAFDVQPGQKLYLAPAERVRVW